MADHQRYSMLDQGTDDEHNTSPQAHLLDTTDGGIGKIRIPSACSITLAPALVLRIISFILALSAFIVFVIDGGDAFIAADIFLALIMILNVILSVQYSISHIFKITVEIRQTAWKHDLVGSPNKPKALTLADIGLAGALTLCLILGNIFQNRYYGGPYQAAVVVGYFVVLCQVMLAVPTLDQKNLTLSARLTDLNPKFSRDNKLPTHAVGTGGADMGSARRRGATPDSDVSPQNVENLV